MRIKVGSPSVSQRVLALHTLQGYIDCGGLTALPAEAVFPGDCTLQSIYARARLRGCCFLFRGQQGYCAHWLNIRFRS